MVAFRFLRSARLYRTPALRLAATLACPLLLVAPTQPLAQPAAAAQARVPVAGFFRLPEFAEPKLSPSGRYLAGGVAVDRGRVQLAVLDLQSVGQSKVVASFNDADIYSYHWVNDQRLVFSAIDRKSGAFWPSQPGLWAIDRKSCLGHR